MNSGLSVVVDICILDLPIENVTSCASVPNIIIPTAAVEILTTVATPAAVHAARFPHEPAVRRSRGNQLFFPISIINNTRYNNKGEKVIIKA